MFKRKLPLISHISDDNDIPVYQTEIEENNPINYVEETRFFRNANG